MDNNKSPMFANAKPAPADEPTLATSPRAIARSWHRGRTGSVAGPRLAPRPLLMSEENLPRGCSQRRTNFQRVTNSLQGPPDV